MFEKYNDHARKIVNKCMENDFKLNSNKEEVPLMINQYLPSNMFLGVLHLGLNEFDTKLTRNVENVLGYTKEEFTAKQFFHKIDKEHIVLGVVFAKIAYELLLEKNVLFTNQHAYFVEFDMVDSMDNKRRIKRECCLLDYKPGYPLRQVDLFTDRTLDRNTSPHVKYGFKTPNYEETLTFYTAFHKKWEKITGFRLTEKQLNLLSYLRTGKLAKEIAAEFGEEVTAIADSKKALRLKVNRLITKAKAREIKRIDEELMDLIASQTPVTNTIELLNFIDKFSLEPFKPMSFNKKSLLVN